MGLLQVLQGAVAPRLKAFAGADVRLDSGFAPEAGSAACLAIMAPEETYDWEVREALQAWCEATGASSTAVGLAVGEKQMYRGAALACKDGSVRLVARGTSPEDGPNWTCRVLDKASSGQARIAAANATLVVAGDDGSLSLLDAQGRRAIHREDDRLRGAALADLDPGAPGLEAATAGYTGRITVLYRDGEEWRAEVVGNDPDKLHHLAVGVLPGLGTAPAIVACGYSGQLHVVHR